MTREIKNAVERVAGNGNGKVTIAAIVFAILGYGSSYILPSIHGTETSIARLEERIINLQEEVEEIHDLVHQIHPPRAD